MKPGREASSQRSGWRRTPAIALLGYLTGCLLPGEPAGGAAVTFQVPAAQPYRVPLLGTATPPITLTVDGQSLATAPYRLESLDPAVVQVDSTGQALRGLRRDTTSVRVVYLSPFGSPDTTFAVQVVVSQVVIDAATLAFRRVGDSTRLTATARAADHTPVADVAFSWASSDSTVARVSAAGTVTALDDGAATISASADGVAGSISLSVRQAAARVQVAPKLDTLRSVRGTTQLIAVAWDSAGQPFSVKPHWRSSDTAVVRVDAAGRATALRGGTARVSAQVGPAADTATVVVAQVARYVVVSRPLDTLTALTDTVRKLALVLDSAGVAIPQAPVTWTVSDNTITTVDPTGLVRAVANGAVVVTAASGSASAFATVVVQQRAARAQVTEDSVLLVGAGATAQLHAVAVDRNGYAVAGVGIVWRQRLAVVATMDTTTGVVTAQGDGSTSVTADAGAGAAPDSAIVRVSGAPQPQLIAFSSARGIEVVRPDGSLRSVLIANVCINPGADIRTCSKDWTLQAPAWSPDGTHLAITGVKPTESWIHVARADGSDLVVLTNGTLPAFGTDPAWSPDGQRIAFAGSSGFTNDDLKIMNADGSGVASLTGSAFAYAYVGNPTWSPDGDHIAFSASDEFSTPSGIFVVDAPFVAGVLRLRQLTSRGGDDYPAWSPDGSRLAMVRLEDDGVGEWWPTLELVSVDGSTFEFLTQTGSFNSMGGSSWSPDGTQIVFQADACDSNGCGLRLWVVNRDGTGLQQLTDGSYGDEQHPSWRVAAPLEAPPAVAPVVPVAPRSPGTHQGGRS